MSFRRRIPARGKRACDAVRDGEVDPSRDSINIFNVYTYTSDSKKTYFPASLPLLLAVVAPILLIPLFHPPHLTASVQG